MKKWLRWTLVFIGILAILWVAGRFSGAFANYTCGSAANEPTLPMGSTIFVSNLKSPQRFDFICVRAEMEPMGKFTAVYRLCGIEGDRIEIRDGNLFVNGENVDGQFNIMYRYAIPQQQFSSYTQFFNVDLVDHRDSVILVDVPSRLVKKEGIPGHRIVMQKNEDGRGVAEAWKQPWNADQFGPVTVPKDSYFVLGDNRNSSADSRYQGFFSKKDFVATVLWK